MNPEELSPGDLVHYAPNKHEPLNLWMVEAVDDHFDHDVIVWLTRVWPPRPTLGDSGMRKSMNGAMVRAQLRRPDPTVWGRFYGEMNVLFKEIFKQIAGETE